MRRDRLHFLLLALLVLARIALGSGAFHEHRAHEDRPDTSCVTCGVASMAAHVQVPPPAPAPLVSARLATTRPPADPVVTLAVPLDARAPPHA